MKKYILIWACAVALLLSGCSKSEYTHALPANSTALMSIDVSEASGVGSKALLQALLMATGTDDCGIDLTQKTYLFETADGTLGLCASVRDADHLAEVLTALSSKGHCKPVEALNDARVTVLNGSWAVAFDEEALLVAGPVVIADQPQMQQRLIRYLTQDEESSGRASKIFQKLDSIDAPMALVAQSQALPEQFMAPFVLGAPRDAEPQQVLIAASMKREKGCLLMEGETFSFNKKIDAALKKSAKVFRPIEGRYLNTLDKNAAMAVYMNVDGKEFLPLMQQNESLLALLAGINSAIDMNQIVMSIDGDMVMMMPTVGKEKTNLSMTAQLAHSQWLADVSYWKTSCPKGSRILSWGTDGYCYQNGSTEFYFGVRKATKPTEDKGNLQFYSGTTETIALASIVPAEQPMEAIVTEQLKNARMGVVLQLSALTAIGNSGNQSEKSNDSLTDNSDENVAEDADVNPSEQETGTPAAGVFPILKALLGDATTIVYTTKH